MHSQTRIGGEHTIEKALPSSNKGIGQIRHAVEFTYHSVETLSDWLRGRIGVAPVGLGPRLGLLGLA